MSGPHARAGKGVPPCPRGKIKVSLGVCIVEPEPLIAKETWWGVDAQSGGDVSQGLETAKLLGSARLDSRLESVLAGLGGSDCDGCTRSYRQRPI